MSEIQAGEVGNGETLMNVRDVEVSFEARRKTARALDGVSLEWRPGEILGVVGESGCGKSTLARAMLGLQPTTEGEFHLSGGLVSSKGEQRDAAQANPDDLPGPLPDPQSTPEGQRDRHRAAQGPGDSRGRA